MIKRARKRGDCLQYQKLFQLHRGRLAGIILDDTEAIQCQIPSDTVHAAFKARRETTASFKGMKSFPPHGKADNTVFQSLIMEHQKNIRQMGKNCAPGPDRLTLGHLIKKDPKFSLLNDIFNLWLFTGTIPDVLQECRTVLIPKSTEPSKLGDINNWRPIIITLRCLGCSPGLWRRDWPGHVLLTPDRRV